NDTISLPSKTMPKVTKVDINDSTIHPILSLLLREHRQSPRGNLPLIVDIAPPVVFRISPNIGSPISERVYEALNELMDFWSYYVQDPVLARWTWVMLAVSVMLNVYLLNTHKLPKIQQQSMKKTFTSGPNVNSNAADTTTTTTMTETITTMTSKAETDKEKIVADAISSTTESSHDLHSTNIIPKLSSSSQKETSSLTSPSAPAKEPSPLIMSW